MTVMKRQKMGQKNTSLTILVVFPICPQPFGFYCPKRHNLSYLDNCFLGLRKESIFRIFMMFYFLAFLAFISKNITSTFANVEVILEKIFISGSLSDFMKPEKLRSIVQ